MPLKTSYDLSKERIIKSRYIPPPKEEDWDAEIDLEEKREFIEERKTTFIKKENVTEKQDENAKYQKQKNNIDSKFIMYDSVKFNESPPSILWEGQFTKFGGFSRMNRAYAFGLSNRAITTRIQMDSGTPEINEATIDELNNLKNVRIDDKHLHIQSATVPLNMFSSGYKIAYTMFENSGSLHPEYVEKLNMFQEVWVPTNIGKTLMKQSGVRSNIEVMPLGVDTDRYSKEEKFYDFGTELKSHVFLSVFKWSQRKGFDVLLKAYLENFSSQDDCTLVLVSRMNTVGTIDDNKIFEDFGHIINSINKDEEDLPHVVLCDDFIPEYNMPSIYNTADSFVLPSRGEGMGLPYLEAAACGLPVIASNCSGHSDFLNDDNSYLIEPSSYEKAEIHGKFSNLAKFCRYYEGTKFPDFDEGKIEELAEIMRKDMNEELDYSKAQRLHSLVMDDFSWEKCLDRVEERIREIYRTL